MVDPWGGFNDSLNNLNTTLARIPDQDLSRQAARQNLALGAIQLQGAQRQEQDIQDRRALLADLQPTQKTVMVDQVGPGAPISNPNSPTPADRAALVKNIQSMQAQPYNPALSAGDNDMLPGQTALAPGAAALQQQQITPLQAQLDQPEQIEGARPQQAVQQTIPVSPEQRIAALTEHAMKTGDYDPVTKAVNMEGILAKRKVELEQGGGDMTAYVKAQTDLQNSKDLMVTITPLLTKGQAGRQMAANYLAAYKAAHPNNPMIQNAKIDDYGTDGDGMVQAVRDPQTGQILGHYIMNPSKGEMEFKQSNSSEAAHNVQEIPSPDGKTAQKFQYNPSTQRYDIPLGPKYAVKSQVPNVNVQMNPLSAEDTETLKKAVAEGRLDPSKINSRTGKILAGVLKGNDLDLNNASATAGALKKVEAQRSMVSTFEKTASKNFDLVEQLYDKNPQGTVMLLNKLKNNINTKITGDPDTVMAGRAIQTALMEYAKVVTGQTGGAAVSDSARKEVESLLSLSDKPETFHGTIANHRREMQNRMSSFQDTINELKSGRGQNTRPQQSPITTKGGFKVTVVQ